MKYYTDKQIEEMNSEEINDLLEYYCNWFNPQRVLTGYKYEIDLIDNNGNIINASFQYREERIASQITLKFIMKMLKDIK